MHRVVNLLLSAVGLVALCSACSAILGDASYRCASDDTGACPTGMVCARSTGVCVDQSSVSDGGGDDDSGDATTPARGEDGDDDASVVAASDAAGDASLADAAASDAHLDAHGDSAATFAAPPVCDGVIGAGEYGAAVENTDVVHATTGQAWYATWDDANLYLAVAGVPLDDGIVVYLSSLATGATQGFDNYDQVTIDPLPFPAQLVFYAKAGDADHEYSEYRMYTSGAWSDATVGTPMVCGNDTDTNAREIVLPWSALGNSARPVSLRFLLFAAASTDDGPFAQVPTNNPSATTSAWTHAFSVSDTAPGGSAPFAAPY